MRRAASSGVLLLALAAGCGGGTAADRRAPASEEPPAALESFSAADSEAERTRALEAQAAEMERGFAEAQAAGATGEEAVDAYREFERQRAELNRTAAEQGIAPDDEAAPPPP